LTGRERQGEDTGRFSLAPDLTPEKTRTILDAQYYIVAERLISGSRDPSDWNAAFLSETHRAIFGKLFPKESGRFRTAAEGCEVMRFGPILSAPSGQIESLITQWLLQVKEALGEVRAAPNTTEEEGNEKILRTFDHAARGHASFMYIHPFVDGNGRVARALACAFLSDCGFPYGTIVRHREKPAYCDALTRAISNDECGDLAEILLNGALDRYIKREGYKLP